MRILVGILAALVAIYLTIAVVFAGIVWFFGGAILTGLAVGIQWPRIFFPKWR